MTIIEAPLEIQQRTTIPDDHWAACTAGNTLDKGNAAGNTQNLLDLSNQNRQLPWLPAGFTARGIVALVFSCISAVLGLAFVAFYGLTGIPEPGLARVQEGEQGNSGSEGEGVPSASGVLVDEQAVGRT